MGICCIQHLNGMRAEGWGDGWVLGKLEITSGKTEKMKRHLPGNWGAAFQVKSQRRGAVLHTLWLYLPQCAFILKSSTSKNAWLLCLSFVFRNPCCSFFYMPNVNHWFLQLYTLSVLEVGFWWIQVVCLCVCTLEEKSQQEYIIFSRIPSMQEAAVT